MTGIEQAIFWFVVFGVAYGIVQFVKSKLNKSATGKPTQDEQDASGGNL